MLSEYMRVEFHCARIIGAIPGNMHDMLQLGRFLRHCIVLFKLSLAHGNINLSKNALQCSPDPERMLEGISASLWVQM